MHETLSACSGDFVGMMSGSDLFTLWAVPTFIASRASKGDGPPARLCSLEHKRETAHFPRMMGKIYPQEAGCD